MTQDSITWAKRAGQAGAVVLALGMLAFYVVWSQRRAQPAAQTAEAHSLEPDSLRHEELGETRESAALFPGSKSLSGVIPESAVTSGLRFGDGALSDSAIEGLQTTGEDGETIDLSLAPEVVEFEGFVNYGKPIEVSDPDSLGQPVTLMLGSKSISQPIFPTRPKAKPEKEKAPAAPKADGPTLMPSSKKLGQVFQMAPAKEAEPAADPPPAEPSPALPEK